MENTELIGKNFYFLEHGGIISTFLLKKDWENTCLGKMDDWNPRLKSIIRSMLFAQNPAFMFWGEEHNVFFNEAFLPYIKEDAEKVLGENLNKVLPQYAAIVSPAYEKLRNNELFEWEKTYSISAKIGVKYVTFNHFIFFDDAGNSVGMIVNLVDKTEDYISTRQEKKTLNKLANLLANVPFAFAMMNAHTYVYEIMNDEILDILQRKREDVIGRNVFEVYPENREQREKLFNQLKTTKQRLKFAEMGYELPAEDGMQKAYYDLVYQPLLDSDGEVEYIALIASNVTDKVNVRAEAVAQEERLRLATESARTAIWDLNLETGDLLYSPRLLEVFGYDSSKKLSREDFRNHIFKEDQKIVAKAEAEANKDGRYCYEVRIFDNKGVAKWIFTNGKIFYNEEQKPARMVGILEDITERKNAEQLLQQSYHRLDSALDASRLGTFDMNLETSTKYNFSSRLLEIFGYTQDEQPASDIFRKHIDPEYLPVRQKALDRLKKTGRLNYEARITTLQGEKRYIEVAGKIYGEKGQSNLFMPGTVRDITADINYRKQLQESEKRYRLLADSIPQIVWTSNENGTLNYWNAAAFSYSGLTLEQFLDDNGWLDIVHPEDREENVRLWNEIIDHKTSFNFEHRFRRSDGTYRWFLSRAVPLFDENNKVQQWIGTSTDIDDMKQQEQIKNDFIKIANHELKTPITTIKGYVQLLTRTHGNSEDKFLAKTLGTLDKQVNKLTNLIGDLLDISRSESGSLPMKKEDFSINQLVSESVKDMITTTESHIINFKDETSGNLKVHADKDRISQVLINLINNAIKYSPNSKMVNVAMFEQVGEVVISVQDFGIGIDEEEQNRIFDRFYRVSGKDERTFPGFGIGLFIVTQILEKHDGKIWVKSKKEEGSTFYMSLPIKN